MPPAGHHWPQSLAILGLTVWPAAMWPGSSRPSQARLCHCPPSAAGGSRGQSVRVSLYCLLMLQTVICQGHPAEQQACMWQAGAVGPSTQFLFVVLETARAPTLRHVVCSTCPQATISQTGWLKGCQHASVGVLLSRQLSGIGMHVHLALLTCSTKHFKPCPVCSGAMHQVCWLSVTSHLKLAAGLAANWMASAVRIAD